MAVEGLGGPDPFLFGRRGLLSTKVSSVLTKVSSVLMKVSSVLTKVSSVLMKDSSVLTKVNSELMKVSSVLFSQPAAMGGLQSPPPSSNESLTKCRPIGRNL
jgi:hypothetical protein